MRRFIYTLCMVLTVLSLWGQNRQPNDCANAIPLCDSRRIDLNVNGYGSQEIYSSCGCQGEEHNSIWFKWTVAQSGTMGFVLTPASTDIGEDYDFWIFGPNPSCSNLGYSLRCSTTNPGQANLSNNLTGMNSSEVDTHEGPGEHGNSWVRWINVNAGETYYLVLDRAVGYGAFSLQWTGTATILNPYENEGFNDIPTIYLCMENGQQAQFNFTSFVSNYLRGHNSSLFSAKVYHNETDATLEQNELSGLQNVFSGEYVLRLDHATAECFDVRPFRIEVSQMDVQAKHEIVNVCRGDSLFLEPSTTNFVTWKPNITATTVNGRYGFVADSSNTYVASCYTDCVDLVENGDFSQGNKGFQSGASYSTNLNGSNVYTIGSNAGAYLNSWPQLYDHTVGNSSGKMMLVNGLLVDGSNANRSLTIWSETVPVQQYVSYALEFSAAQLSTGNNSVTVEARIDNTVVTTLRASQWGSWQTQSTRWTAPQTKYVTLSLVIPASSRSSQVAVDDISFKYLYQLKDSFEVNVLPATDTVIDHQICIGDSFVFNGQTLHSSGTYVSNKKNAYGCDSIVTLNLSVGPFLRRSSDIHICRGESYTFRGKTYTTDGVYRDTFPSRFSCDSLVELTIHVHDDYFENIKADLCFGEEYHENNFDATTSGHYEQHLLSQYGCDSVVTLDLMIRGEATAFIANDFCVARDVMQIDYTLPGGEAYAYELRFETKAENADLHSLEETSINQQGTISILLPENVKPGIYNVELLLIDSNCVSTIPLLMELPYSNDILVQKWNDVIAVLNSTYNGGYTFSGYQWQFNGVDIPGETHSYIYLPQQLDAQGEYSVLLTRADDGVTMHSCPIRYTPHIDLWAYPRQIGPNQVQWHVESGDEGEIHIYNSIGQEVWQQTIAEGANDFELSLPAGVYVYVINNLSGASDKNKIVVR